MSGEEIPDPIAALDQAIRGLKDWARTLYGYYSDLTEAGFGPAEAMTLTVAFQAESLRQRHEGGES